MTKTVTTDANEGRARRFGVAVAVVLILVAAGFASPFALAMYQDAADRECGKTPHFDGSDPASRYNSWTTTWSWTEPGWVCLYHGDGEVAEKVGVGFFPDP